MPVLFFVALMFFYVCYDDISLGQVDISDKESQTFTKTDGRLCVNSETKQEVCKIIPPQICEHP